MPNDLTLGDSHPATEELKPIKVGGESTALEVSKEDVRVNNLYVNGTTTGVAAIDDTKLPLAGGTMTGDIVVADGFVLDGAGDMVLDAAGGDIDIKNVGNTSMKLKVNASPSITLYENAGSTDDYFQIHTTSAGGTTLSTIDAAGSDGDFTLDIDGDITLDSETGAFIAKKAGTEFSAANSAYAGMILGYSMIRNEAGNGNTTDTLITLNQTSFTLIESVQGTKAGVTFIAPPSGNVEIEFCASMYNSSELVFFGLSTSHSSYTEVEDIHTYDNFGNYYGDETDRFTLTMKWVVEGLTAGTSYTYYIWYKVTSGTAYIYHGESDHHAQLWHMPPVITKATALPSTFSITGD